MSASDHLNAEQFLDLYHRTTPEAAEAIYKAGAMTSKEHPARAYFSTKPDGENSTGYGDAVKHSPARSYEGDEWATAVSPSKSIPDLRD